MIFDLNRVIEQIEKDKGVPKKALIEAIESAMMSAARKKLGFLGEMEAHYNEEVGEVELFQFKTVAETVTDPNNEVSMAEAKKMDPEAVPGDSLGQKIDANILGRIAAQTAKQVIIQKLRDAERDIVFQEYKDRVSSVLSGIVRRMEKGNIIVDLGKTEAVIPYREQIPGEAYKPGDRIQAYFLELNMAGRGAQVILSRRHPALLKALFEMELPEVSEGIVQIVSCAREPGVRAKVAVYSKDGDVDPVGACVGMKGSRVQSVVQELRGEKIDIVLWDEDSAKFVCNAIAPAEVSKVIIREQDKAMEIIVPDDQLSLAIGKRGQNVRLAANLTGWNIDIYSESKMEEMAKMAKTRLVEDLEVDDGMATILYSNAFRSAQEIADVPLDEFLNIPGLDQDKLKEVYSRAVDVVANPRPKKVAVAADDEPTEIIQDQKEPQTEEKTA
jgi:N utilization substance protein A